MNTVPSVRNRVFLIAMLTPPFASLIAIPQPQQEPSPSEARPSIAVKDGMLTLHVQKRTLASVLEEIGEKAGVVIKLGEDIEDLGDEQVSVDFKGYRLDEGLRQILKNHDAFFFYGVEKGEEKGPASLKVVWVYGASRGQGLEPVAAHKWASTKEVERMLKDPEGDVRARAIEELIKRKGQDSTEAVLEALKDPSERVRTKALYRALDSDAEIPQDRLIDLALKDESETVRFLALQALSHDPDLRWVVERAALDPSERISETAQDILRQLDAASQPPGAVATTQQQPPDEAASQPPSAAVETQQQQQPPDQ